MYEYYGESPISIIPVDDYLNNPRFTGKTKISDNPETWTLNGWTPQHSNDFWDIDFGKIGSFQLNAGNYLFPAATKDNLHDGDCIGIEARWANNYAAYEQETKQALPVGTYRLTYEVQNVNSGTEAANYEDRFYVKVGNQTYKENNNPEWMGNGSTGWTKHTIEFSITGSPQKATISLGFGIGNNQKGHLTTPALYVCNFDLDMVPGTRETDPRIIWNNEYIESIEVVKKWTGIEPLEKPKTTYYSWLKHQLRFSVEDKGVWWLDREKWGEDHYGYDGLGLCNTSGNSKKFYIHNLNAGDEINIEYYKYDGREPSPTLESGSFTNLNVGDKLYGKNGELVYYKLQSGGEVCINIPSKTIIRAVRIIHNQDNYQKATYSIQQVRDDDNNIGYKYTLTGEGVLEDKRGAVPYITMRFGADNDMTFVRNLGDNKYAASSIIDETNDFNPTTARAQHAFRDLTEAEAKDHFAGKEWTIFSADLKNNNTEDDFSTILPNYGSYYYFFPEVDGKLSLKFYCEGKGEHMPFWFKSKDGKVKDEYKAGQNTDGSNYYEINNIAVEKGGVYYLCSNPTIVQHEHPIVRLISYEFIPSFRVDPLYKVVANGTTYVTGAATIKGVTIDRFEGTTGSGNEYTFNNNATVTINGETAPMIKCLGNIKKEGTVVKLRQEGNDIKLDFPNIAYKEVTGVNQGGAIVVNLECPAGEAGFVLTVAYDAANAKWDADGKLRVPSTDNGTQVKKWDFYSGKGEKDELGSGQGWDLGKYGTASETDKDLWTTDFNSWKAKSKLFKEVNKHGGLTADWVDTYVNLTDGKNERIFKSVYDMEGDNADMIHETAGLIFLTHANQLGIMNENDEPTAQFQDRYIGLMKGSKFTIPLLDAGDRIVLKMGTYNNEQVTLGMTNAKDVSSVGKTIGNNYIIGGSVPVSGDVKDANGNVVPRGEYHIQAIADGDVDIEVVDGQLLKLYTIEIYRNAANSNKDILTENSVTTAYGPELLFTDEDAENSTKDMEFYLRYNGFEEPKAFGEFDNNYTRGNLSLTSNSFSEGSKENSLKATFTKGDFGSFRADATVKTKDTGNTYVTDYAPGSLAVDYLNKVDDGYPYTWDFTDLLYIKNTSDKYIENAIQTEKGGDLATDYKGWSENAGTLCLRNAPEQEPGILFANGGQIYGANVMFAEMAGIGFKRSTESPEDAKLLNKAMGVKSGALELNSNKKDVFYKLVIPKVDADAAIYVRATPVRSDDKLVAQYSTDGENASSLKILDVTTPNDVAPDDKIYVMKNDGDEQDIELWLNGMAIKKIAVATDEKKVNEEGWNTESRGHATDPSLLPYMTGKDFRTYIVKEGAIDATNKVVTLQRVDGGKGKDSDGSEDKDDKNTIVIPAATDGSLNACIVRYVGDKDGENIFEDGNGFHLFAPDMHDKPAANAKIPNSLLRAQVSNTDDSQVVPREQTIEGTTYYNYAFTNKYKYVDEDGEQLEGREGQYTGKQAFYRIMASGAKSGGNQAYLSITTSPAPTRLVLFIDGEDSEATGIATVENSVGGENARFYNLNGQQLSGKPNRSGLYIVNGKKVSIKNK